MLKSSGPFCTKREHQPWFNVPADAARFLETAAAGVKMEKNELIARI
jgi:hypothetical protein